ncbi:iron complex transport system substrate-binding protein [Cohnella sp. OV330]|uniref:ABC transporter substrate-binding protein n=1 Tax=Cohnella sp. OV330 TaxID=1855288 RepID=UPI0008ECE1BD|nr:ABC transporter substrate-binding protein [Cohnella sp. OV330]SFB57835.1 iron complex transport system substrate-binding protein [Cohnella sp. OV330]
MNRFIRFAQFVSFVVLISVLAACGNSNAESTASETASATAASGASASSASSATAEANDAGDYRVLTDAAGHEVKVPAHPRRIIAPFLEDPLSALGIKPVAQWSAGGVPQQYLQDKLAGVPALKMDGGLKPEEALSYNPDLIIFLSPVYVPEGSYEQFAQIAPTFVLSDNDADWRGNLEKLGKLMNDEDAASAALKQYDDKLADAKARLGDLPKDKTAVLLQGVDEKGFKLFGPNFYGGVTLYQALGFKQPAVVTGNYETYSIEKLAELADVDYIFVISGPGRAAPPSDNPLWKSLKAVKAGQVFEADSGYWFNQNSIASGLIMDDVLKSVHA